MKPFYFFFCMLLVMSCSKSSDDNNAFAFTPLLNIYTGSTASVTHQQEILFIAKPNYKILLKNAV